MPPRKDFDRHIQREQPLPVYAIVSPEPILLSEAVAALRGRVLTVAADFNRDELRAGEQPVERAIDAASTLPMMAPRRFVHLSDIQRLKAKELAPLATYLEKPSPTTVLCLSGDKLDQRTKVGQKLLSAAALFSLEPPRKRELGSWIEARARKRELGIDRDAAQLVGDLIGTDLGALDMALEKLATYAGGERITTEHVEAVVAPTRVDSIFELTDAIGGRDLSAASLRLRNTLGAGESALMVLAMMARQVRQLIRMKELRQAGASPAEMAQAIGIRPFLVEPLGRQAQLYRIEELTTALAAISRADIRLKSSKLEPGVILDRLLVEIIASGGSLS